MNRNRIKVPLSLRVVCLRLGFVLLWGMGMVWAIESWFPPQPTEIISSYQEDIGHYEADSTHGQNGPRHREQL